LTDPEASKGVFQRVRARLSSMVVSCSIAVDPDFLEAVLA